MSQFLTYSWGLVLTSGSQRGAAGTWDLPLQGAHEWWAQNRGLGQGQPCPISSPRPGLLTGRPLPALPAGLPLAFSCPPPSAGSPGRGKHFSEGLGLNGGQRHRGLRVLQDPKQGKSHSNDLSRDLGVHCSGPLYLPGIQELEFILSSVPTPLPGP